jgi:hypothetical protein
MAKTVFVNGDQSQNIAPTYVLAAWLNKVFAHRHDGLDADGSAPINYADDTGAANAYVIALTPALPAYIPGMLISFKAANACTGTSTLNINGLGAIGLRKNYHDSLASGDIRAGQIVTVSYDGVMFQLINNGQAVDASMYPWNYSASGYQKLPNGFIIQWGLATAPASGDRTSSISVTFALAFPHACFAIVPATRGYCHSTAGYWPSIGQTALTAGGVLLVADMGYSPTYLIDQAIPLSYIAVGY